jgi:hypothetical protein
MLKDYKSGSFAEKKKIILITGMLTVTILLSFSTSLLAAPDANILYVETDLGNGLWKYDYTFYNTSGSGGVTLYSVFFDFNQSTSFTGISLPTGWAGAIWPFTTMTIDTADTYSTHPMFDIGAGNCLSGFSFTVDFQAGDTDYAAFFDVPPNKRETVEGITSAAASGFVDYYCDKDNDRYVSSSVTNTSIGIECVPQDCQTTPGDDCDDDDDTIHPNVPELCDDLDNNCDGNIDEELQLYSWYHDFDGDGYGNPTVWQDKCSQPEGYVADNNDCDDSDANIHPDGPDARIVGPPHIYKTYFQDAYDDADANDVIESRDYVFVEELFLDENKSVVLRAGFDCGYSVNEGITRINGKISINSGSITIESGTILLQ